MPIQFQCPSCGNTISVADQHAGKRGRCKHCGHDITIPGAAAAQPAAVAAPHPAVPPPPPPPPQQPHALPATGDTACPKCGSYAVQPGPWPWYLGTVGAIFVRAMVCRQCGHHFDAKKPQADLAKRKLTMALLLNGIGGLGILVVIGLLALMIINMGP